MTTPSYVLASNARIVIGVGGANEAVIKGLNKLGLPSIVRGKIKVEEFGVDIAFNVPGSAEYGDLTAAGNLVVGDDYGQGLLKSRLIANTKFTDMYVYLDHNALDFLTCDIRNDSATGFYVLEYAPGEADKNGVFPISIKFAVAGRTAIFTAHKTASTIAIVNGTPDTITDSASGFVTAGFKAGQTLIIEGSTASDGQYLIASVSAGTITLSSDDAPTAMAAGTSITLHGGVL